MPFAKAAPQQARLKMSMYGPPGSGKTFSALLFAEGLAKMRGKRVAYVDTERGTDFYAQAVAARQVHPEAFDFDPSYTRSLAVALKDVREIDTSTYGVVVIDSISHLWDAAIEAYAGKRTSHDTIPMHAWGAIKRPYKALINALMAAPLDVLILGRQKNLFDGDSESMRKVGVAMRAEGETAYEPHICLRMEASGGTVVASVEKDRTGVLQGKLLINPSFTTIEPLIPLLGDVQAPAEDEDERIAADSELITEADDKVAKKEERSRSLMEGFTPRLYAARTLEEIGALGSEIAKNKRYMTEAHLGALRSIHASRRDAIVNATAKEI